MFINIPALVSQTESGLSLVTCSLNIHSIASFTPVPIQRVDGQGVMQTMTGTCVSTWGDNIITPMSIPELQKHIESAQRQAMLSAGLSGR